MKLGLWQKRNIWITAYYILRKNYFVADAELRKTDLESRINQKTFPKIPSNTAQKIMFSIY